MKPFTPNLVRESRAREEGVERVRAIGRHVEPKQLRSITTDVALEVAEAILHPLDEDAAPAPQEELVRVAHRDAVVGAELAEEPGLDAETQEERFENAVLAELRGHTARASRELAGSESRNAHEVEMPGHIALRRERKRRS